MKRKFFSILVACVMAIVMVVPASASVIVTPASEAVCSYVSEIPENATLLDSESFLFVYDDNGKVTCYDSSSPMFYDSSTIWDGDNYEATISFYQSGSTYYVKLSGSITDTRFWFTHHTLDIRPKNNSGWFSHDYSHETKPTSITDVISFNYPNGAPTDVSVEVKGSITVDGDGLLLYEYGYFGTRTLDDPS